MSNGGDLTQIGLIREHLDREARAMASGDYADPAAIHGTSMPGLRELRAGAREVVVTAENLPKGARIRFRSQDPRMVAALHEWFAAQVRDHGADAVLRC